MGLFTEEVLAETSSSAQSRYLNVSKIDLDRPARIAILQSPAFSFHEIWGESVSNPGEVKPFRFSKKPTEAETLQLMGGGYRIREVNPEWAKVAGELERPKRVHAFTVWNFESKQVEILSIKQKTIIDKLKELSVTEEYSDLLAWDLQIKRIVEGRKTSYSVTPLPRKKTTENEVETALSDAEANGFDITRMLDNGDPFTAG